MMLFGTLSNRPKRVLEPMEKISEILFALIMVLTFTCSFSIAGAGREGVRELVIGALGCNLAWGLIDAAFYLMGSFSMLGQGILQLKALSQAASQAEALFGLGKNEMSDVVLIPGLKVSVNGASDEQGRFVAKTITVDGDDLETAEMIQSGLHPTAQQVAANVQKLEQHSGQLASHEAQLAAQKETLEAHGMSVAEHQQKIAQNISDIEENSNRFSLLADYDVKGQATVKFGVGSATLDAGDQQTLQQIAQTATSLNGYIVEVTGYADSTGSAAMNTKLSEDRARAVIAFLMQQGGVPVRHIAAPGAMGEYGAMASNETKAGRPENRRVEVKILVNKGITGS